jgi:2-methylcitrate dehydratase PrpD
MTPLASGGAMNDLGVSRQLARFVAGSRAAGLPPALIHEAKRSLLNHFAAALAGASDPAVERLLGVTKRFSGPAQASLVGRSERLDMPGAAFINAVGGNVFDFDDTHPETVIHPAAPVAPALLALAESRPMGGLQLLHALALGIEVECRIGNAVSPGHYARGWHITSTCGVFGAAAAVGHCLGLDEERVLWAFGNASAQSAGLIETLGTMAKSISVGNAARNGLLAAFAAEAGVYGPEAPIEGERGFLRVFGEASHPGLVVEGLGEQWEALRNTYKPWPCGIVLHAVIDACLRLRQQPGFAVDAVTEVIVRGPPLLAQRADRPRVEAGREAQVSAQHAAAVALLAGRAGLREFSDAAVADPAVRALRAKVRLVDDASMGLHSAEVHVTLADGQSLSKRVEQPLGSTTNPLSDGQLEAKLRELLEFGSPQCEPGPLIDAIWSLDKAADAGAIMRLASPSPRL